MHSPQKIIEQLDERRRLLELGVCELAQRANVPHQSVTAILARNTYNPGTEIVQCLANAVGLRLQMGKDLRSGLVLVELDPDLTGACVEQLRARYSDPHRDFVL